MILPVLLALSVAFPRPGQLLPPVTNSYIIGAVEPGVTNLTVQGRGVKLHPSGAWTSMLTLSPLTNSVTLSAQSADGGEITTNLTVIVKLPSPASTNPPPKATPFTKLSYASDTARPHPSGKGTNEVLIVIDPGHGGNDPGALSPHGWPEKDINLKTALGLARYLRRHYGYRVELTRTNDTFIAVTNRPRRAHQLNADAFISIHHNAPAITSDVATIRYRGVYAWNPLGERLAAAIAARLKNLGDVESKGALKANFAVTRNPEIPSCLIEIDFLTNPEGEAAIFNDDRLVECIRAIAAGINDWRVGNNP